jgi:hypothetical protein
MFVRHHRCWRYWGIPLTLTVRVRKYICHDLSEVCGIVNQLYSIAISFYDIPFKARSSTSLHRRSYSDRTDQSIMVKDLDCKDGSDSGFGYSAESASALDLVVMKTLPKNGTLSCPSKGSRLIWRVIHQQSQATTAADIPRTAVVSVLDRMDSVDDRNILPSTLATSKRSPYRCRPS